MSTSTDRIPLIVYGDGPRLPSGLARIARDLTARLVGMEEDWGIEVLQLGVDPPDGWHWQSWPFFGFQPTEQDQGRAALRLILEKIAAVRPEGSIAPIVLMIMDPSRCYDLTRTLTGPGETTEAMPPAHFWGYFPIDSENVRGSIGGPAAEAIRSCDRVLGYGEYGATVLRAVIKTSTDAEVQRRGVPYISHGIEPVFRPGVPLDNADEGFTGWRTALRQGDPGAIVIGCVATNQPRKDLSLLFSAGSILRRRGLRVAVWLHTDRVTHAWDIGQLAQDFDWPRPAVCVSTHEITDEQLAARYCASTVTLAPGLGEGFGYPIVESLACGVPVVHVHCAGGPALFPHERWLVRPRAWRLESIYAIKRPVLHPEDVAAALAVAIEDSGDVGQRQACIGSAARFAWEAVWPKWELWLRRGIDGLRLDARMAEQEAARRRDPDVIEAAETTAEGRV